MLSALLITQELDIPELKSSLNKADKAPVSSPTVIFTAVDVNSTPSIVALAVKVAFPRPTGITYPFSHFTTVSSELVIVIASSVKS